MRIRKCIFHLSNAVVLDPATVVRSKNTYLPSRDVVNRKYISKRKSKSAQIAFAFHVRFFLPPPQVNILILDSAHK